ncbi:hypothetical protein I2501_32405 [Streptacidiphilus sp. NEAU-YB345]|uniref:Uncharacterized protein n=1 Tax=Streptacidiphilus fuscans TaxID=2789292 RepID=A0A931B7N9_9ACTN|nr:hypothetical protein [Streptacidiphilus fuscans]
MTRIDPQDRRASLPHRWGVPLGVAAGVAAVSFAAVAVFGGSGTAKPTLTASALSGGSPTSAATSPRPNATGVSPSARASASPTAAFTVTSTTTTPIDTRDTARILASCLGSDAPNYHAVIAVRAPAATQDWDGAVVAVDSSGQYVQCEAKGDRGTSQDVPATFINNRMWGTGHLVEYFDSVGEPVGPGRYLALGAGHYTSDVAKITISYGNDPEQYPALMSGGAFFYAAAFSTGRSSAAAPFAATVPPYIHAFNAAGQQIYDQAKDPQFTGNQK